MIDNRATTCAVLLLVALAPSREALAADTVETFCPGSLDVEMFVGYSGIGPRGPRGPSLELFQGFGIVERFSAYLDAGVDLVGAGAAAFATGIFGTPLDTDHVDLDLLLDFDLVGPGTAGISGGPALELNLDLEPDLALLGGYLRVGAPLHGHAGGGKRHGARIEIHTALGSYVTIRERHQLLVELSVAVRPLARADEGTVEVEGIGLGYNVHIHEAVELVTELFLDVPQRGERFSAGLLAGFILTMPGGGLHTKGTQ